MTGTITCEFCGFLNPYPEELGASYTCNCGARYSIEYPGDIAGEVEDAKEDFKSDVEVKIVEDIDRLLDEPGQDPKEGERVDLVFIRPKRA